MTAYNWDPHFFGFIGPTAKYFCQDFSWQFFDWKSYDIECKPWNRSHGINVRQGIGGSDLAKLVGIIDNRGEKIDCLYD